MRKWRRSIDGAGRTVREVIARTFCELAEEHGSLAAK